MSFGFICPAAIMRAFGEMQDKQECHSKPCKAHNWIRTKPEEWFRDSPIDDRDRALLNADFVSFVRYTKGSFLKKIHHLEQDAADRFESTNWTVENDVACKKMVAEAGGQLIGFDMDLSNPTQWKSMKICVNIEGTAFAGFDWGFLGTKPSNMRIFRGPPETCKEHPWDAMILRDCYASTTEVIATPSIASRYWDILCMKMCEDYDWPWVVTAVKDAGPYRPENHQTCYQC